MKLNKLFFVVLSIALLAGFASCSDDDEKKAVTAETIVGKWESVDVDTRITTTNAAISRILNNVYDRYDDVNTDVTTYTFNADSTYTGTTVFAGGGQYIEAGTYSVKDGVISFYERGELNYTLGSYLKNGKLHLYDEEVLEDISLTEFIEYFMNDFDVELMTLLTTGLAQTGVDLSVVKVTKVENEMELISVK